MRQGSRLAVLTLLIYSFTGTVHTQPAQLNQSYSVHFRKHRFGRITGGSSPQNHQAKRHAVFGEMTVRGLFTQHSNPRRWAEPCRNAKTTAGDSATDKLVSTMQLTAKCTKKSLEMEFLSSNPAIMVSGTIKEHTIRSVSCPWRWRKKQAIHSTKSPLSRTSFSTSNHRHIPSA